MRISQDEIDYVHTLCDLWRDWANAYGYLTAVATIAGQSYAAGTLQGDDLAMEPEELVAFFRKAFYASYRQALREHAS